ncbi:MAG: hypothetical protein U9O20_04300 [Patescibacteria group bacterium]|nr:hypothetical protein [Patescibacteria group bacterium]
MSTTKRRQSNSKKSSHIKDILLQVGGVFFHNLFDQVKEGVKVKLNKFLQNVKRVATVTFLVVVGVLFLFVGMANLIDSALGIKGSGFLFIGIALTLMGYLIHMLGKSSK